MFSDVVGHEKVKNVLKASVESNRVGHAYIFEGPRGVGRCTTAKAFASLILCEAPKDGEPCGSCKSCRMCQSGNHPDVQIITNQLYDPSKKSTDVLVDTVRNMKKDVYIKPFASERKIYIVPRADTMNLHAQNSLLKVLEEPPQYCTIILIAENSNSFLPTILSRAVQIRFFPIGRELVEDYIRKSCPDAGEGASAAASMSGGCIGKALLLAESDEFIQLRNRLFELVYSLTKKASAPIYDLAVFLKRNKDEARLVFDILKELFRDLMYFKQTGGCERISNTDKAFDIQKIGDKLYETAPVKMLEIILKYSDYLSKNISYAQIAQCMSLELWEAIHDRSYRCEI